MRSGFLRSQSLQTSAVIVGLSSVVLLGAFGYAIPESLATSSSSVTSSNDLGASATWNICEDDFACDSVSISASKTAGSGIVHMRLDTISDLGRLPNAFGEFTTTDSSIFTVSDDLQTAKLNPVQVDVCTNFDESNDVCLSRDTWTIGAEWSATDELSFLDQNNGQTLQPAVAIGTFNDDDLGQSNQAYIIKFNTATGSGGGNNISQVIDAIKDMNLQHDAGKVLVAPLAKSEKLLHDDNASNDAAVCGQIGAFQHIISAFEKSHKLTVDQADQLGKMAKGLLESTGCS